MKNKISLKMLHIILIILGTIYIFSTVFHNNIWFDEAYSVGMANHNFIEIWNIGKNDVHPVLYYWLLRLVNILTNGSILAYRVFSTVPIVLLGILGITHVKKDFGEKTGIVFSFFTYFLPMMAVYANQIRMYSWAVYIVIILAIYGYRIYLGKSNRKNWIIFGIMSLVSLYIHYYGLMAAGLINVFLLIHFIVKNKWKELKVQIILGVVQVIAYIPWFIALFSQMKNISGGFWITFTFPETLYELIGCQFAGILDFRIGFCITILFILLLLVILFENKKDKTINWKPAIYSISIYLLVILAAVIITKVLNSEILYYRYLFVITGLYIFAFSYILAQSNNKYLIIMALGMVFVLSVNNIIIQGRENYALENKQPIEYLNENIQEGDVFIYNETGSGFVCATIFKENEHYFYNKENWGVEEAYKVWAPQLEVQVTTEFLENFTGRIWVIGTWNNSCYEELFDNESYKLITNKYFATKYEEYPYNITLVEKVKNNK